MSDEAVQTDAKVSPWISRQGLRATILGLVVFVAAALALSAWYRSAAPRPPIAVLDQKLEDFAAVEAPYDIVFLGSSQTFRHIDPAVIDAGLRQCGLALNSYNFGIPALRQPELDYVAQQILKSGKGPQLLVLQNPIRAETVFDNMMSPRGRYFRGGAYVDEALEDVQCYTGRRRGQARSLLNNLRVIVAEIFALGRMAETFVNRPDPQLATYDQGFRENAGFWPVDADKSDHVVARLTNTPMTGDIIADARARRGFAPAADTVACRVRQLTETLSAFRDAGTDVAYYVSPAPLDVVHDTAITRAMAARNRDVPILDFNTPEERPQYFDPQLWFDNAHLTGEGARRLSADVAVRLCDVMGK